MDNIELGHLLIKLAQEVRDKAYDPYTKYFVGSALLGGDGKFYTGVNVGNASAGLGVCAERVAILKMVSEGCREVRAMAIMTHNGGSPCGACRQVLVEFASDIPIWLCDEEGNFRETSLFKLLPDHFSPKTMGL